jgi:hypothetical protein
MECDAMMNRAIDGIVTVARLKRGALGQSIYSDVTIRRTDGSLEQLGSLVVANALRDVLAPGTGGRFYFHDIMGARGLHGFQPAGQAARMMFPRVNELALGLMGLLNLVMVFGWMLMDGGLRVLPFMIGVACVIGWAVFTASRQALTHDFRHETRMMSGRFAAA